MSLFFQSTVILTRLFFRFGFGYRVYGAQSPHRGCAILASNHSSFLDPLLIGISWPEETHYLAKKELFEFRLLRFCLNHLNTHPVEGSAKDIQSIKMICQLLNEGKKVVIFPEGGRSLDGQLQPLRPGVALLALRTHCPIIPVYLHGTYEAWPRQQRWPKLGIPLTCVFGQSIAIEPYLHLHRKQAQEALTEALQQSLEKLQQWFEAGAQGDPP